MCNVINNKRKIIPKTSGKKVNIQDNVDISPLPIGPTFGIFI
jgi:hypothetical protein